MTAPEPSTPRLAVLTPSYAPDLDLFGELHASVLTWTPPDVVHHVVVPRRDLPLFRPFAGPRCVVRALEDVVPRRMVGIPGRNMYVNLRRPFPPIRGWVMQQLVKLELARTVPADVAVLIDSDIVLVRPLTADLLVRDGVTRLYRVPESNIGELERHPRWQQSARRILGLPPAGPPYTDYISSFMVWDTRVVALIKERIETVTSRPWLDVVGSLRHVSEWTIYGVFVDEVLGAPFTDNSSPASLCHSYWGSDPLTEESAARFLRDIGDDDVAVMIYSKSGTPLQIRRAVLGPVARGTCGIDGVAGAAGGGHG